MTELEITGLELVASGYLDELEKELLQRRNYDELLDAEAEQYVLLPLAFLEQIREAFYEHYEVWDDELQTCLGCYLLDEIDEMLGDVEEE